MKKVFLLFLFVFSLPTFATGISGASAPCDNATLAKYTGTADIEINWEPNTINLNWYDGDTKLTVANSAQSCVYDSTLTVPQQPTKPGYTFNGWKVIHVPGGFTELQYIEATGTEYINTNVLYESNDIYKFVGDMQFTSVAANSVQCSGVYAGASFCVNTGNWSVGGSIASSNTGVPANTNRHVFDLNTTIGLNKNVILKIDNNTYTNTRDIASGYAGVFGIPNGSSGFLCSAKLYSAKLYKNGNMVFNGVPARRNSDGVLGMYDTVTDTFFTTAGTGTFVAGPVVQ